VSTLYEIIIWTATQERGLQGAPNFSSRACPQTTLPWGVNQYRQWRSHI